MPTTPIAAMFDATIARDAAAVECLDLLASLESAVRANVSEPATWSHAGSLTEVRSRLAELAAFLGA
jgi:hypothetical protein